MKRRFLVKAAALCAVLTFGFTASGFAQVKSTVETQTENDWLVCSCGKTMQEHQDEIAAADTSTLDYLNCSCGGRLIEEPIYTSAGEYTGESTNCKHSPVGMDYEKICTVTYEVTCSRCTLSAQRQEQKAVWECDFLDGPRMRNEVSTPSREVSTEVHQEEIALPEENEEAKSTPCSYCGGNVTENLAGASTWVFTGEERLCAHGTIGGYDKEMSRTVIYQMKCSDCDIGSDRVVPEITWECHGVV